MNLIVFKYEPSSLVMSILRDLCIILLVTMGDPVVLVYMCDWWLSLVYIFGDRGCHDRFR